MEGVFVALAGKRPEEMTPEDYRRLAEEVNWKPGITDFAAASAKPE